MMNVDEVATNLTIRRLEVEAAGAALGTVMLNALLAGCAVAFVPVDLDACFAPLGT